LLTYWRTKRQLPPAAPRTSRLFSGRHLLLTCSFVSLIDRPLWPRLLFPVALSPAAIRFERKFSHCKFDWAFTAFSFHFFQFILIIKSTQCSSLFLIFVAEFIKVEARTPNVFKFISEIFTHFAI
jgi:hypothetical protein